MLGAANWRYFIAVLNKALSHDKALPVDTSGFAWLVDACYTRSSPFYKLRALPTWEDVLSIVAHQEKVASRR